MDEGDVCVCVLYCTRTRGGKGVADVYIFTDFLVRVFREPPLNLPLTPLDRHHRPLQVHPPSYRGHH